jgi:hypothetical protein
LAELVEPRFCGVELGARSRLRAPGAKPTPGRSADEALKVGIGQIAIAERRLALIELELEALELAREAFVSARVRAVARFPPPQERGGLGQRATKARRQKRGEHRNPSRHRSHQPAANRAEPAAGSPRS